MPTLSLRGLARLMGVSEKAVRNALAVGVFSPGSVRRDETGVPEVVNATLAVDEWEKSGRQLRGTARRPAVLPAIPSALRSTNPIDEPPPAPSDDVPAQIAALLARVRTLREALPATAGEASEADAHVAEVSPSLVAAQIEAVLERGRKLRMENDVREGLLLEAGPAGREAFEFARIVRETILNVVPRVAAELAAETDATRVHLLLERALREALASTAATLDAAVASG